MDNNDLYGRSLLNLLAGSQDNSATSINTQMRAMNSLQMNYLYLLQLQELTKNYQGQMTSQSLSNLLNLQNNSTIPSIANSFHKFSSPADVSTQNNPNSGKSFLELKRQREESDSSKEAQLFNYQQVKLIILSN